jgi:hypothetical protein
MRCRKVYYGHVVVVQKRCVAFLIRPRRFFIAKQKLMTEIIGWEQRCAPDKRFP